MALTEKELQEALRLAREEGVQRRPSIGQRVGQYP